jgi:uncharacterized protein YicC (UPF0701 family)
MSQTTQISPNALHQAAQRLADALLDTLTQECDRARAEEGFEIDDCAAAALSALTSLTAKFATHFEVERSQLVASLIEAMNDASEELPNPASRLN